MRTKKTVMKKRVKSNVKKNASPLQKVYDFIQKKKSIVTKKPVGVAVSHKFFGKNEMAHMVAHPTAKRAKEYTIVYKDTFYNRNKQRNIRKLKQIAAHELAHIKQPHLHNNKFKKIASKLGAGKFNTTGRG